ncbi:MAG TPA: hypothetical protein P5539_10830 [Mesotoga sp.]|nr:hypothetical protein [Mesotoga sp.]
MKVPVALKRRIGKSKKYLKMLYMAVLLRDYTQNGTVFLSSIEFVSHTLDSNLTRSKKYVDMFLESEFVRGRNGDVVFLESLKVKFNNHLREVSLGEISTFGAFRDFLVLSCLEYYVHISAKSVASLLGMSERQVRKIIQRLVETGQIERTDRYVDIEQKVKPSVVITEGCVVQSSEGNSDSQLLRITPEYREIRVRKKVLKPYRLMRTYKTFRDAGKCLVWSLKDIAELFGVSLLDLVRLRKERRGAKILNAMLREIAPCFGL